MALPNDSALAACLAVLSRACISARMLGWAGEENGLARECAAELAHLMDAVHNIPYLLQNWERCDEQLLRGMLGDFDDRCPRSTGGSLLALYDEHRRTAV
jgi:hypothetical protein